MTCFKSVVVFGTSTEWVGNNSGCMDDGDSNLEKWEC